MHEFVSNRPADFERVRKALLLEGEPDYVPQGELWIDNSIMTQFLGQTVTSWCEDKESVIEFWHRAGYDYAHTVPSYHFPKAADVCEPRGLGVVTAVDEHKGLISSWEDFERYPWPKVEDIDYGPVERAAKVLPDGMKLISGTFAGVFEESWFIMGFETLALKLAEDPELVKAVVDKVGSFMLSLVENVIQIDGVGAFWISDDIAYKTSTMLSPDTYRKLIFPWYRKMVGAAKARGLPAMYHSDGNLWEVLDDLVDIGFNAIHPIEPLGMDINELKKAYGKKLCLVGNIGLEYELTMGTPDDVDRKVRERIETIGPGGGYICGSSNTIPDYVPFENFVALITAIQRYGKY